jgi:hypothetical protein
MARKSCLFKFLLQTYATDPKTATDGALVCHIFHCGRIYHCHLFECILLQANLFQLVRILDLNEAECRSLSTTNQCWSSPTLGVVFPSVILNIICDFMSNVPPYETDLVFILPLFLLRKLQISRRQSWGLVSIFILGGLAILMSVARLIALACSAATTQVAVWTALECSIAIIVACCPALRVLLRRSEDREFTTSSFGTGHMHHLPGDINQCPADPGVGLFLGENEQWEEGARLRLVMSGNGTFILKNVDFEIMSETASHASRSKTRMENWDSVDRKIRR